MERAQQIKKLFDRYTLNYNRFSELNDALLVDCDPDTWQKLLTTRSEEQRKILADNEDILKQARGMMLSPICCKEEADEILLYFRRLANLSSCDYSLLEILYQPLSDFYEKTGDDIRLIGLNVTASAVSSDKYGTIQTGIASIDPLVCCQKAIACSKRVSPLVQPDAWISVFSAYANLLGSLSGHYPHLRKDFFRYYDEAMQYFEDPQIGPVLLAQKNGPSFRSVVAGRFLYANDCYEVMSPTDQERFRRMVRSEIDAPSAQYTPGENARLQYYLRYLIGDTDARSAYLALRRFYREWDNLNFDVGDTVLTTVGIMDAAFILESMLLILTDDAFPSGERGSQAIELADIITKLIHSIPYGYMTAYVNATCASLCETLLPLLRSPRDIQNTAVSLLILRQPITYIHSLMVREIACTIARTMLADTPELFIPLYGNCVREVQQRSSEILAFIADAALLHDIGKTKIADIINNQYRRLSDTDFRYIKLHPGFGPEILLQNPDFSPFFHIMLGHHKTYDGSGGYPATFDNTRSDFRIIIDLITIADCTDAATDILGRNYARGKSFYDLLGELSAGKGTRYNPDIVALMEQSDALSHALNLLTGDNRKNIYYQAYRDVIHLNEWFS